MAHDTPLTPQDIDSEPEQIILGRVTLAEIIQPHIDALKAVEKRLVGGKTKTHIPHALRMTASDNLMAYLGRPKPKQVNVEANITDYPAGLSEVYRRRRERLEKKDAPDPS